MVALSLLVFGLACSYAYAWASPAISADVQNIAGALMTLGLLVLAGLAFGSVEVWSVVALLSLFKVMVIGCNTWYVLDPWPVKPGQPLCSTRLNLPLGVIGLALAAALAAYLLFRGNNDG